MDHALVQPYQINVTSEVRSDAISLEDLLPTMVQIFGTILLGWLTGTFKIISPEQAGGLGTFVGKYSLPSLVFISLATFDFDTVCLAFLLGIFCAKLAVFLLALGIKAVITGDLSKAAMFAILCTQTNDFAMGVPLLEAVLGQGEHPYKSFLYLAAPVSLVVLNPVGFVILETQKKTETKRSVWFSVFLALKNLATNPIIVMTLLGVFVNFLPSASPPAALQLILAKIGACFTSLAPFSLGLGLVGKLNSINGSNLSTIIILVILKCFLAPFFSQFMVAQATELLLGMSLPGLENYSFLYGTFPPALGVMAYASLYQQSLRKAVRR